MPYINENEPVGEKYKCVCGHTVEITSKIESRICSWCGRKVTRENQTLRELQLISYFKQKKKRDEMKKILN